MDWSDPEIAALDIRVVPPLEKHGLVFRTFDDLRVGEGFVLVNDYDPKALWQHFNSTRRPFFGWEYLERGPLTWRIGISRRAGAASVKPMRRAARGRASGEAGPTAGSGPA